MGCELFKFRSRDVKEKLLGTIDSPLPQVHLQGSFLLYESELLKGLRSLGQENEFISLGLSSGLHGS